MLCVYYSDTYKIPALSWAMHTELHAEAASLCLGSGQSYASHLKDLRLFGIWLWLRLMLRLKHEQWTALHSLKMHE